MVETLVHIFCMWGCENTVSADRVANAALLESVWCGLLLESGRWYEQLCSGLFAVANWPDYEVFQLKGYHNSKFFRSPGSVWRCYRPPWKDMVWLCQYFVDCINNYTLDYVWNLRSHGQVVIKQDPRIPNNMRWGDNTSIQNNRNITKNTMNTFLKSVV